MRSPLARWKIRHLVGSWLGYWIVLAAVTLTPAVIALWKVSGSGVKGTASISAGERGLHAIISAPASTLWEVTVPLTSVALAIAGPPLLIWMCWVLFASMSRDTEERHPAEQLASGGELPLRRSDRARDAMR